MNGANTKLAIVTGTSRGLGEAIAQHLLARGWVVFGFARTGSSLNEPNYYHVPMDLTDLEAVEDYFEGEFLKIIPRQTWRKVALINNAGQLGPVASVEKLALRDLQAAYQLNSILPTWLMGFCRRHWRDVPLTVVNISSGAAVKPYAGWVAYCSTKAALRMAGQVLAEDVNDPAQVRVLSYAPGVVDTAMQEQVRQSDPDVFAQRDRFVKLFENGELIPPEQPAGELVELMEQEATSSFEERRFGQA
jgi:benzil reductase ((S)-benzoin forming)